jgi:tRNA(Ile)-lysidine synthase
VADAVELAFHRAARELVPDRTHVLVAVSGGGDSVALAHLLHRFAARRRIDLTLAHLDHALRPGSKADRTFVARLAESLEAPLLAERRDVRAEKRKDESLEEAARRVRRQFLKECAHASGASLIATGHTLDDQAETILMRLVRGAGPSAIASMAAAGPGPFVRPLLGIERRELRGWLRRKRIRFRDDPTNASMAFDRNRVRRLVLPLMEKVMNPKAARHIVDAAARLRDDAALLDLLARDRFQALTTRKPSGFALDAAELALLPRPLAARVARLALDEAGCDPRRVSSRHVDAVVGLALTPGEAAVSLPGAVSAVRSRAHISFMKGSA